MVASHQCPEWPRWTSPTHPAQTRKSCHLFPVKSYICPHKVHKLGSFPSPRTLASTWWTGIFLLGSHLQTGYAPQMEDFNSLLQGKLLTFSWPCYLEIRYTKKANQKRAGSAHLSWNHILLLKLRPWRNEPFVTFKNSGSRNLPKDNFY